MNWHETINCFNLNNNGIFYHEIKTQITIKVQTPENQRNILLGDYMQPTFSKQMCQAFFINTFK